MCDPRFQAMAMGYEVTLASDRNDPRNAESPRLSDWACRDVLSLIEEANEEALERYGERVLSPARLEEVFQGR